MNIVYTNKPIPFSNVSRCMELMTTFDEHNGQLSLPRNRTFLNVENAEWFVKNARKFNPEGNAYNFMLRVCEEYLQLANIKYSVKANG